MSHDSCLGLCIGIGCINQLLRANINHIHSWWVPKCCVVRMRWKVSDWEVLLVTKNYLQEEIEIKINDDRDPLPVILIHVGGAENDCHFLEVWGHDGLCHRRVAASGQNIEPKLHLDPGTQVWKLELFETLFMKNVIFHILLILINENIEEDSVTYDDFCCGLESGSQWTLSSVPPEMYLFLIKFVMNFWVLHSDKPSIWVGDPIKCSWWGILIKVHHQVTKIDFWSETTVRSMGFY